MTKDILVPNIPINAYSLSLKNSGYDKKTLECVYRDMLFIREFETAVAESHSRGEYAGVPFKFSGPAHLSLGQEAVAVGKALATDERDFIFGTHRSHGELIARGLRFQETQDDDKIDKVMFGKGAHVSEYVKVAFTGNKKHDCILFTLYGAFAEIFGRKSGFQKGLGGSMHAFFTPLGIYPNNAIVGGSAPLALGASLYKLISNTDGIVISDLGDGAMACGSVYEAMNFASMKQFRDIWDTKRGLPLLFAVTDNVYARGGNTHTETSGMGNPARLGAGINPEAMHAETVDGFNPLAVADAVSRKKALLLEGKGPALLNFTAYRFSGHSLGDNEKYRSAEEVAENKLKDPITTFGRALLNENISSEAELIKIREYVKDTVAKAFACAVSLETAPNNPDIDNARYLEAITESELTFKEEEPRKTSEHISTAHKPREEITYRDAIAEAVEDALVSDPNLTAYGEDVRGYGSQSSVFNGLETILPHKKLFNAPIAESAIIGSATGYAMCGGRALIELLYADFMFRGADELVNQLAKWRGLSGGEFNLAVTLRLPVGKGYGAQHSQDPVGMLSAVPGLKIIYPATPYDAKGLVASALSVNAPVVVLESRELYDMPERFRKDGVPIECYKIPFGESALRKTGTDITVLTLGPALYSALSAQEAHPEISMEIIDARSIVPFDYQAVCDSVKKTGRLIVAGVCNKRSSILSDIAVNVQNACFRYLKAPVAVVGAPDTIIPNSVDYYDGALDILNKAKGLLTF